MKQMKQYIVVLLALLLTSTATAANIGDIVKVMAATNKTTAGTAQIALTLSITGDATVAIGNGYNACISQYTDGEVSLPGEVTIDGKAYRVTKVSDYAFQFCTDITKVTVPKPVTTLGEYVFNACTKLREVSLPATLKTIGDGAFYNCAALTLVRADMRQPASTFGFNNIFQNLQPKKTLKIPAGKKKYYLADNNAYDQRNLWDKYFIIKSDPQTFVDRASGLTTTFNILEDGTVELLSATNEDNAEHATYTTAHYLDAAQSIDETYSIASIKSGAFSGNDALLWVDFTRCGVAMTDASRTDAGAPLTGMSEYTLVYLPQGNNTTGENLVNTDDGSSYTCTSLRLSGNRTYDIPYAFHADAAVLERTFTAGRLSTLFAPFAIPSAEGVGTFFDLKHFDATTAALHFSSVSATEPNHAYLFRPATALTQLSASSVDVAMPAGMYTAAVTPSADNALGATFYGVYRRATVPVGAFGYLAADYNKDGNSYTAGTFVRAGHNVTVRPYRAFLWLKDASGQAKRVIIDDLTTAIQHPSAVRQPSPIYNLTGQRVKSPRRGVYIINGRKVIIK